MTDAFPTRQYPYRREGPADAGILSTAAIPGRSLVPDTLYRFVLGLDSVDELAGVTGPRILEKQELDALGDPFARMLATSASHPLTARTLVAAVDATGLTHESFVVGEGLHLPWSQETATLARQLRIVVAWKRNDRLAVLLSTAPPLDDRRIFLQVIGWDEAARHFNFYERRLGAWIYAGNSRHALSEPTRGQGPFDSHVNGALVMKELRAPWLHWSSMAAFDLPGVKGDDPLQNEALFRGRVGAEKLETLVRASVQQWTAERFESAIKDGGFMQAPAFMRQVLTSTTVNLISSPQESKGEPVDGRLKLPVTPFLDTSTLLDLLAIEVNSVPLSVKWDHYQRLLVNHGYELRDEGGQLARRGDTHFAFPAFERALEDQKVTAGLLQRGLLSKRVAACLVMVDFTNPVWSPRRESLMRYVPETASLGVDGWDLGETILKAVQASGAAPGSPEAEFLALWNVGEDWSEIFGQRLTQYLNTLQAQLDTWEGFEAVGRLIESQRRRARKRPLLEFSLTLPRATNLPDADLRMTFQATVEESH